MQHESRLGNVKEIGALLIRHTKYVNDYMSERYGDIANLGGRIIQYTPGYEGAYWWSDINGKDNNAR